MMPMIEPRMIGTPIISHVSWPMIINPIKKMKIKLKKKETGININSSL
jgi:hypothetical protein